MIRYGLQWTVVRYTQTVDSSDKIQTDSNDKVQCTVDSYDKVQ